MIKSYLLTALRNIFRYKTISAIHIAGLSIGIAACIVIYLYVQHETGYDNYNRHAKDIVRITTIVHAPESDFHLANAPGVLENTLPRELPDVVTVTRLIRQSQNFRLKNDMVSEQDVYEATNNIFRVFDFKMIHGDTATALQQPGGLAISASTSIKYFGKTNPVGKLIESSHGPLIVRGVFEDRPANTDLKIDILKAKPIDAEETIDDLDDFVFVRLKPGASRSKLDKHLALVSKRDLQPIFDQTGAKEYSAEFKLEPLADVHFSKGKLGDTPKGNRNIVMMFTGLAMFILLVALLNYVNLATARSVSRAREVGVRKVIGAGKWQLIRQFLFESACLVIIAWLISLAIVFLSIRTLEHVLEAKLSFNYVSFIIFNIAIVSGSILLAGFYPAFVLSGFQPSKVLKGKFATSASGNLMKKIVTTTQFAIAIAMIFCTIVIYRQMNYISKIDIGFNADQLLTINLPNDTTLEPGIKAFQSALLQRPGIGRVSLNSGFSEDSRTIGSTIAKVNGKQREVMAYYFSVDESFLDVYGMKLTEGRNFSSSITTDQQNAYVANLAFINEIGCKKGVGQEIEGWVGKGKIIGVIEDFHFKSLHNKVEPTLLVYNKKGRTFAATFKTPPSSVPEIKSIFARIFPSLAFDYSFVTDYVEQQYRGDTLTLRIFTSFTILAIILSTLGLFALISLILKQRQKEIGVRQVLGAKRSQLFALIGKDFGWLMLAGSMIALPVAAWMMRSWLQDFAYSSGFDWWIFAVPTVSLASIAVFVIYGELMKATAKNPSVVLKAE